MSTRLRRLLVLLGAILVVAVLGATARTLIDGGTSSATDPDGPTAGAGPTVDRPGEFLDDYVDPDGRVVRRDQGNDTVSEGQAYGMLVAAGTGDRDRFASIWGWTRENLVLPSGLLAWHWQDGRITDPEPASDADLDAAHALLLAAERFGEPGFRADALALGAAILDHEVVAGPSGPVLVAGPWARGDQPVLNPSYVSLTAYSLLGAASGDPTWAGLSATGSAHLTELTEDGTRLPPDWARLEQDGSVSPLDFPSGRTPGYGYDAFRVVVRAAGSCDADARALAASLAGLTAATVESGGARSALDGTASEAGTNPLFPVAAAAGAAAADDASASEALLGDAADALDDGPTYYLSAWLALGRLSIDGTPLGGCPARPG